MHTLNSSDLDAIQTLSTTATGHPSRLTYSQVDKVLASYADFLPVMGPKDYATYSSRIVSREAALKLQADLMSRFTVAFQQFGYTPNLDVLSHSLAAEAASILEVIKEEAEVPGWYFKVVSTLGYLALLADELSYQLGKEAQDAYSKSLGL